VYLYAVQEEGGTPEVDAVFQMINCVTNKLIKEVSRLLVLVGLAARQIRDVVTGQAQASHE